MVVEKEAMKGVKIAEFAWLVAGPLCAKPLVDHGATVVRIESIRRPDMNRLMPPYKDGIPGVDRAGHYATWNANKYSMALNLAHARAPEVIMKLVGWADIVTENFAPGTAKRLGLDYESLKEIKEDIIFLQASIQGQTGPHSRQPGFGIMASALVGLHGITGWPDRPPVLTFGGYSDLILPEFGCASLLAALDYRRRTGKGQWIDLSQYECAAQFIAPLILDYIVNGKVAERMGNACPYAAPHGAYPCKGEDRWCVIAVFSDAEWDAFCRAIGKPAWTKEERFRTLVGRKQNEDDLNNLVSEWTKDCNAEEVMTRLQDAGVAAGVVESPEDLFKDPQLKSRNNFWLLEHKAIHFSAMPKHRALQITL